MSLKHYLATYTVIDGEHEHLGHLLIRARDAREAPSLADSLTHDTDCWDDEGSEEHPWSYGDGTTTSQLRVVHEVNKEQFRFVKNVMAPLVYKAARGRTGAHARVMPRPIP